MNKFDKVLKVAQSGKDGIDIKSKSKDLNRKVELTVMQGQLEAFYQRSAKASIVARQEAVKQWAIGNMLFDHASLSLVIKRDIEIGVKSKKNLSKLLKLTHGMLENYIDGMPARNEDIQTIVAYYGSLVLKENENDLIG